MRAVRHRVFALLGVALLMGSAALARDQAPGPGTGPNGTAWGVQCLAESRGQGSLGIACCTNLQAVCLDSCNQTECDGAVADCIGARNLCYHACELAYAQCIGAQPAPEPSAGTPATGAPRGELELAPSRAPGTVVPKARPGNAVSEKAGAR